MTTVKIGQPVNVAGFKGFKGRIETRKFIVEHAANGGRVVDGGPIYEKPFAFTLPAPLVVDGGFTARKEQATWGDLVTVQLGEEFVIEGYGVHTLEQPPAFGDWLRLVRVADGFAC